MPAKNKSTKKEPEDKQVAQVEETNNQVDVNALIKTFTHIVNLDKNHLYKENTTQSEYEDDLEEKNKLFLEITQLTLRINNIRGDLVELIVKIQQEYKSKYQLNNSVNINEETDDDVKKKDGGHTETNDDDVDDVPIVDVKLKSKVEPGETVVEEVVKTKKTKKTVKPAEVAIEESEPEKPVVPEKSTAVVEEVQDSKPKKKSTKKVTEPAPPVNEQPIAETKKKKTK